MDYKKQWEKYTVFQKSCALFVSLILLYSLTGFFLIPWILKSQLKSGVREQLGRELVLEKVRLNPFELSASLEGLALKEKGGDNFVGFERFYVNFQLSSLFRRSWTFAEIALEKPFGHVVIRPGGEWNFSDLLSADPESEPEVKETAPAGAPPSVTVFNLHVDEGAVTFKDESRADVFSESFGPLNISLVNFTTRREQESPYQFQAGTGGGLLGEEIAWKGNLVVTPLSSQGSFEIKRIKLPRIWEYIKEMVGFEIKDGSVDLAGEYSFSLSADGPKFTLGKGMLLLSELAVTEKGKEEVLIQVPVYGMEGITFDLSGQALSIDRVQLEGAQVETSLAADGRFNLERVFAPVETRKSSETSTAETDTAQMDSPETKDADNGNPFQFQIGQIVMKNNRVMFRDNSLTSPAEIGLEDLALEVTGFSLGEGERFSVAAGTALSPAGRITITGDVGISPLYLGLDLGLQGVGLSTFQPYLDEQLRLKIRSGELNVGVRFTYSPAAASGPQMNIKGDMALENLDAWDGALKERLVKLDALKLTGLDLSLSPLNLFIDKVLLAKPEVHLSISEKGALNFGQLSVAEKKGSEKSEAEPESAPAPIAVNRLDLDGGSFTFKDNSIKPGYRMAISELTGSISGISSDLRKRASMDLAGKWNGYSPIKISGEQNFLAEEIYSDMKISLHDIGMVGFSPYSGRYIGRKIDKGKLNLDIACLIDQRNLKAENRLFVDQFDLGDRVKSPHATKLPVSLAIGLLKDRKGEINIDLPIEGNLDDPDFKYGTAVWKTLGNLIVKTATSPFSFLADLAGSDNDLSAIMFSPGEYGLLPGESTKLEELAKALNARKELSLEIKGGWDPAADKKAFQKFNLARRIEGGENTPASRLFLLVDLYKQMSGKDFVFQIREDLTEEMRVQNQIESLEAELLPLEPVGPDELSTLAQNRAYKIRDMLEAGGVQSSRLFISNNAEGAVTKEGAIPSMLTLKAD